MNTKKQTQTTEQHLEIQKIYVKQSSFEAINTPDIFKQTINQDWNPEVSIDLQVKSNALEENYFEVVLNLTVIAKKKNNNIEQKKEQKDENIFTVKAQQAGIFYIKGFNPEELKYLLNAHCASILYPYAREVVSDMVMRANLPPLHLAPMNFDVLHEQQQSK